MYDLFFLDVFGSGVPSLRLMKLARNAGNCQVVIYLARPMDGVDQTGCGKGKFAQDAQIIRDGSYCPGIKTTYSARYSLNIPWNRLSPTK